MSKVFIDTSALFRARSLFERLVSEGYDLYISPIVIYEFVKVLDELIVREKSEDRRKLYVKLRNRLPSLLRVLDVRILPHELTYDELEEAYRVMKESGVDIGDALMYLLLKRNRIGKILTYDKDWARLDVEVLK